MHLGKAALLVLASLGAACAAPRQALDVAAWQAEGRVITSPEEAQLVDARRSVHWTDGELELRREEVATLFARGVRLLTDLEGTAGTRTTFVVDTGSTFTLLSAAAPLAQDVRLGPQHRYGIANRPGETGYLGYLPEVGLGPLVADHVTVALTERSHTTAEPANILGLQHLFHLQLEGDTGRWWLRSGASRRPSLESGWSRVALVPGTPLLHVRSPEGATVLAMIDTGAWRSTVVKGAPEGGYHVLDDRGHPVLPVAAESTVDWPGMEWRGERIVLLIGLDVLARRACRLTFDAATWAVGPPPAPR
ncbi:MAG: aspartyl protease family protein [Planctomycetota bacterium]